VRLTFGVAIRVPNTSRALIFYDNHLKYKEKLSIQP